MTSFTESKSSAQNPSVRHHAFIVARSGLEYAAARVLFEEYAAQIGAAMGVDLGFQGFAAELERLPEMYGPPTGCLLLASADDQWAGCGALRRFSDGVCEMKRLYIRPSARRGRVGRLLAGTLVSKARELGYRRMVLDTLEQMTAARSLYRSLGFRDIDAYYFNPMKGVSFMELDL